MLDGVSILPALDDQPGIAVLYGCAFEAREPDGLSACWRKPALLPQYSPDLNPIELVFHPLKTFLRKAAERTIEGLHRCVRSYIRALDPSECRGYFRHSGYDPL